MKKLADLKAEVQRAKAMRVKASAACDKADAAWFKADAALTNVKNRQEVRP